MSGTNGQQPNPAKAERDRLLATVAAQQTQIRGLDHQVRALTAHVGYIAHLAGVGDRVAAMQRKADAENPAQPVPNPPSEQAFETTEQAVTPETNDDVRNPGMTPGSVNNIAADTTDVALAPGASLPTSPFNELQNVQAPVAGTETQLPLDQTRIETDVRVGDPMNPQGAFPWNANMGPNQSNTVAASKRGSGEERLIASIRLARLRLASGTAAATDTDMVLGQRIASSSATVEQINAESATLEGVQKAAAASQARPAGVVPRMASNGGGVARTAPSLAGGGAIQAQAAATSVDSDTADADIFI